MRTWVVFGCIWVLLLAVLAGAAGYFMLTHLHEIDEENALPYYYEVYDYPFPYWTKDYISINATGLMTAEDWWALQNVMNEWNYINGTPKLLYNQSCADISIEWALDENETWAGATWVYRNGDITIEYAHIHVRTSWPHAREFVIRHELGHAMGLAYHSNHRTSTMYHGATGEPDLWSSEDIEVIRSIYNR